jgi:hypothetical protein
MAQAVSHWLSTRVAQVQSQVRSRWICGGQNDTEAGFLQVLWFPLSILIPPPASHSLLILSSMLYSLDADSYITILKQMKCNTLLTGALLIVTWLHEMLHLCPDTFCRGDILLGRASTGALSSDNVLYAAYPLSQLVPI